MALITQISGISRPQNASLFRMQEKLEQCGAHITHPLNDGFIYAPDGAPSLMSALWTPYQASLDYYEATVHCDLYVIANDEGVVNEATARGILHAMRQSRPILFLHKPVFDRSVGALVRDVITSRLHQFVVANIFVMNDTDVAVLLQHATAAVDYNLSRKEQVVIQVIIKKYFRDLLPGKKQAIKPTPRALATV